MSAMGTAITGLQSSQKWLDVISNNVSNSQTVAYKQGRLTFSDLISDGLRGASSPDATSNLGGINPTQLGLGVTVGSIQTIMKQGTMMTTGNVTDVAINGTGFLTVAKGQDTLYTRAGNLTFDLQGNLVTADGGLVQGWSMKSSINPSAPGPMLTIGSKLDTSSPSNIGNIQIPNNLVLAPKATSLQLNTSIKDQGVIIKGNLDNATPLNANALPMGAKPTAAQLAAFTPDAVSTFTVKDSLGTNWDFTLYWQQVANTPGSGAEWQWTMWYTPGGATPNTTAIWDNGAGTPPDPGAFIGNSFGTVGDPSSTVDSTTAIGALSAGAVIFAPDGSLERNGATVAGVPATVPTNIEIDLAVFNGAVGGGGITGTMSFSLNFGTPVTDPAAGPPVIAAAYGLRDGLTGDYGNGSTDTFGNYTPTQTIYTKSVDGYSEGTLLGLSFNQTGGIDASFDNGQIVQIAKLALTKFDNQDGLARAGGNYFAKTANSGLGQIGTAGSAGFGTIQGGALEGSNVDLTVELTNMILAQRMFESNARVVTSADKVLDTLVNLGR